jgi:hypothetical protein
MSSFYGTKIAEGFLIADYSAGNPDPYHVKIIHKTKTGVPASSTNIMYLTILQEYNPGQSPAAIRWNGGATQPLLPNQFPYTAKLAFTEMEFIGSNPAIYHLQYVIYTNDEIIVEM